MNRQSIRVLHLTDDLDGLGGVQSYLKELVELMPEHGISCELYAPDRSRTGISSHYSRWASRHYERVFSEMIALRRPTLVHAHNVWMSLSPTPLRAARASGIPTVMTVHDYHYVCPRKWMIDGSDAACERGFGGRCLIGACRGSKEGLAWLAYNDLRWLKVALHRRMLRSWVNLFISPSHHLATWLRRSLEVNNVVHVPNFSHPRSGADHRATPGRLLFMGRLSREKGVDVLLRSMPALTRSHPNVSLVVAGSGPEEGHLRALAASLDCASSVDFVGVVTGAKRERLYQEAEICVLPTLWMENCPVAVLEAMGRGRPVVASRIGGLPELIRPGVTGELFERGDHDSLARTLGTLLDDPAAVYEMGRQAARVHRAEYTAERHAERLRSTYETALAGDR